MMRLTPLSLTANTIFYLILSITYCRILTRRFSHPITALGLFLGYLAYILPTKLMPYADIERIIFGLVTFPLVPLILFRDKWYKSVICAVTALVVMAVSDLLSVSFLLSAEQLQQGLTFQPTPVQLAVYAIFLSTDAFLLWIFTLLMNRYKNRLSGREWVLYVTFPISQYLLIYGWMVLFRVDFSVHRVILMLCALAVCVAADAALFAAIRGMAQRSELKARNDLLARQIELQKLHYSDVTAQYEHIRRMRHDISSHLYTIEVLLKEGQYDRAAEYSAEVSEACRYKSNLGSCENPIVDAFLFFRSEELTARGYDMQMHVSIPANSKIHDADMIVGFGNLLDNAVEACQNSGKKQIYLLAHMEKGYLYIEERNPLGSDTGSKGRRIPELERGIGFHILKELAEKYSGSFDTSAGETEFTASLILKGAE